MKIKKLEIKGFKSFPYRTEILISPKITIVVGPNGCGKTNIFEAILFALGEKKPENLRANMWQDLIFSGGKESSRSGFAEVAIVLENEGEEFEIRRRILRDGRIENYIDGEYISHLKWNEKIYEIFPQGKGYALFRNEEIERIIVDAPKVLRELIHSACGIELFEKKKETLRRRLLRVEREIERLEDLSFEKERRVKELEREVERLRAYWEIKKRIEFLERKRLSINYYYIKREFSRKEREREEKLKEIEIYRERERRYKEELENIRNKISEIAKGLKELEFSEKETLERERGIIEEKAKLVERKENLFSRRKEIEKRLESIKDILVEINREMGEFEIERKEISEEEFKIKGKELEKIEDEINNIEKRKNLLEIRLTNLVENIKILEEKLKRDEEALKEEKEKLEAILKEIRELKKEKEGVIKNREKMIERTYLLNQGIESLEKEMEKSRVKVKEMGSRISYLEAERNERGDKFLFEFLDLNDEKTIIFNTFFYYPVFGLEKILNEGLDKKAFIEEKVVDFINSQISKVSYTGELKDLLKKFPELDENKIYITKDGFIVEKGCIVEKIRRDKIEREKELKELKRKLRDEEENLNNLLVEYRKIKEEKEGILKELNEIEDFLVKREKDLRIKETEFDITELSIKDLEKKIRENSLNLLVLKKESDKLREELEGIKFLLESKKKECECLKKEYEEMEKIVKNIERFRYLSKTKKETEREREENERKIFEIEEEIKSIEEKMKDIVKEEEEIKDFKEKIEKERENLIKNEKLLRDEEEKILLKIEELRSNLQKLKEEVVAIQVRIEGIKEKMSEFPEDIEESYPDMSMKKIEEEIEKNRRKLYEFEDINLAAEKEYEKEKEEYTNMLKALSDVKSTKEKIKSAINILEEEAKRKFFDVYNNFKKNIKDVAKELLKGEVNVELENQEDPLTSEFLIRVSPFGKKVRSIHLLSGGERALFALSVIFALHKVSPVPFCVLDEVDAALDDANTLRFVDFIKKLSYNTQLFIITHNKRTMEAGDILYGVSMEDGISKIFSLKLEEVR